MDNAYLTGPQGTMLNIGSWFQSDQPPDYGAHAVIQQQYAENAFSDGAVFSYETAGKRTMRFPLIVPSGGAAALSLDAIEAYLRMIARPGGYVDLQPDGVATAEMVRFDVIGGRVNHDPWSVGLQRVDRRKMTVELDVQPFGYWPTWITLASAAAAVPPFTVPLDRSLIIGDAPALARLAIVPSLGASSAKQYAPDFVAWGIGNASSPVWVPAASFINKQANATFISDANATYIGGLATAIRIVVPPAGGVWKSVPEFERLIADPVKGRFRAYGYFRADDTRMAQISLDVRGAQNIAMASAAPIATIVAPSSPAGGASPAYSMYDLGEITVPHSPAASYSGYLSHMRLWWQAASLGGATWNLDFAGIALVPVDGANGILPYGLARPTYLSVYGNAGLYALYLDAQKGVAGEISTPNVIDFTNPPVFDAYDRYRGVLPRIGASAAAALVIHAENRQTNQVEASWMPATRGTPAPQIGYSLQYRPSFQFLKGL